MKSKQGTQMLNQYKYTDITIFIFMTHLK